MFGVKEEGCRFAGRTRRKEVDILRLGWLSVDDFPGVVVVRVRGG